MPPLKFIKQEKFCLEYFKIGNATEAAIKAGYKQRSAYAMAAENLKKPVIISRLAELQKKAEDASVMTVLERKQRLTEIARARTTDFVRCVNGVAKITVDLESFNSGAIQEVTTDEIGGDGKPLVFVTKLKLRDPVGAIAELNKMDGAYAVEKHDITSKGESIKPAPVFQIVDQETKDLLTRIQDGERTVETDQDIQK